MADPQRLLEAAVFRGDVAGVAAALAAGADPNASIERSSERRTALHAACALGRAECAAALYTGGADAGATDLFGRTAMSVAIRDGHLACLRALLRAGVDPATADPAGWTVAHHAAAHPCRAFVDALMDAAPEAALLRSRGGALPLACAVQSLSCGPARCLLERGALAPPADLLEALQANRRVYCAELATLYAPLVARQPLSPAEWARVPTQCPGLGAALLAVLARSEAEAALLVARLPTADAERLRTAALCLRRAERAHGLALPPPVLHQLLAVAANGPVEEDPGCGPEGWLWFDTPCAGCPGLYTCAASS